MAEVEADAFKRLYPEQYHDRFLSSGVRPDGRPLGRARAVTIGAGAVTTADGSALVKIGSSSALAGVRMDIIRPDELAPGQGQLVINTDIAQFASADYRPGRPSERITALAHALSDVLLSANIVDLQGLCFAEGKAAWRATLDIYVLDADGAVLDSMLLAAVAALLDTRIPGVRGTKDGHYLRAAVGEGGSMPNCPTSIALRRLPLSLTCGLYKQYMLVDPTADEEAVASSSVSVVVDQQGQLHGVHKTGGKQIADAIMLSKCVEAARLRYKEVAQQLEHSLRVARQGMPSRGQS